ncbi:MAG: AmmeMemoRadiSam system protein B [Candidatus Omnitrophota bacterium]
MNRWTFIFLLFLAPLPALAAEKEAREPFVAGVFYPEETSELSGKIDHFLSLVPPQKKDPRPLLGLILPHAGYIFSGQTAAYGYQMLNGRHFDTVILIGPYHRGPILGASIWRGGAWKTPLGSVPVDAEMADALFAEDPSFQFTQDAHLTEHSLEVQLPFLQKVLKNFKIVPILTSVPSLEKSAALAKAILKHSAGKNVLVIASTDMSHYHTDAEAKRLDEESLKLIEKGEPGAFSEAVRTKKAEFCGSAAVLTMLELAKFTGNADNEVLRYATSAEASHDESRVVGYGSVALYKGKREVSPAAGAVRKEELTARQRKKLLKIARQAVNAYVTEGRIPEFRVYDPALKESKAVFVTLRKEGKLRGCIGQFLPNEPLYLSVRNTAIHSAVKDARFQPVTEEELKDLDIEISVLSAPRRVKSTDEIIMGVHGVIVRQGGRSGVFLPKVATETLWNKETFLKNLCKKTGFPDRCSEDPTTELYTFTSYDF